MMVIAICFFVPLLLDWRFGNGEGVGGMLITLILAFACFWCFVCALMMRVGIWTW